MRRTSGTEGTGTGGVARVQVPVQAAAGARAEGATGAAADRGELDRLGALAARLLAAAAGEVTLLTGAAPAAGESPGAVAATGSDPLVVDDARVDPRTADLPGVTSGAVRAILGVPLVGGAGRTLGALCVLEPERRCWSDDDVALLQQLAPSVVAELELSALSVDYEATRLRWALGIEAAGIGSFDWDLLTGELQWDGQLIELFGYDSASFDHTIEAFNRRLHPEDLPRVNESLTTAIARCGEFRAEYRVVLPTGVTRWVQARGRALGDRHGRAVRLLGAAYDTTAVHDGEARVARVLETMSAAFYALDREWRFSYVNAEAERLLGRPREELLGGVLWELFPATVGSAFETTYRGARESGEPATFDAYYPAPLDGWYELRVWPTPDGLSVYFLDISDRRQAYADAERGAQRLSLLARVSAELGATLDGEEAVARLAQLVVPSLADWCLITLVEDDGRLRDVGSWHTDPALRPAVERYSALRMDALTERSFLLEALRTGRPVTRRTAAATRVADVLRPGEAQDLLVELAPESVTVLPLPGRDRTVGLLSLFAGPGRGRASAEDHATAEEVASRAGLALDNVRLYRQQRRLAEDLQRSLLTDPVQPDQAQIVVRYVPAAETAQVGGDWYDAFLQPGGATVLVIGDVVGHDTAAAAAMGQLRALLRGIAFASGAGPAQLLAGLDAAMEGLQIATTATAVVARIEQTEEDRERGLARVRWSNAGHPPPMVIDPDGRVSTLARERADLLLGIDPAAPRAERELALEGGSTLLLYTDGLVERRDRDLDHGLTALRDALADLAGCSLDHLCDDLLARLLPVAPEDDVALVAVRLHRQNRPRPPEAGPDRLPASAPESPDG